MRQVPMRSVIQAASRERIKRAGPPNHLCRLVDVAAAELDGDNDLAVALSYANDGGGLLNKH